MKTIHPHFKKKLTGFQVQMLGHLESYWLTAREFHISSEGDYRSAAATCMIAKEKNILRNLGLPERSFKFSYPIQRLGFEPHCSPELLQGCLFKLMNMAELYLMSPAKTSKKLLEEALVEKTPAIELFAEINMPTTCYVMYLYHEHFLCGQIPVEEFLDYLNFLRNYRPSNGREIPYDLDGLDNQRWYNDLLHEDLLFFDAYIDYLKYIYAKDPWIEKKLKPIHGIDCPENLGLILEQIFLLRVDSKLSTEYVRIEAILPQGDQYHQVEIACSLSMFRDLISGCKYYQTGAHLLETINRHIEQKDFAFSLDMNDICERSLEIDRCFIELSANEKKAKKGGSLTCFNVAQIEPRSSSFLVDE